MQRISPGSTWLLTDWDDRPRIPIRAIVLFFHPMPYEFILSLDWFKPFQLGDLTLANWLVMATMTRNRADEGRSGLTS